LGDFQVFFKATHLLFYRLSQQKVSVIKIVWGGMKAPSVIHAYYTHMILNYLSYV